MMETLVAVQTVEGQDGKVYQFSYYRIENGKEYGVCIRDQDGAVAMAPGVTTRRRSINSLLRSMIRGSVSPATMVDVVEDWLVK